MVWRSWGEFESPIQKSHLELIEKLKAQEEPFRSCVFLVKGNRVMNPVQRERSRFNRSFELLEPLPEKHKRYSCF